MLGSQEHSQWQGNWGCCGPAGGPTAGGRTNCPDQPRGAASTSQSSPHWWLQRDNQEAFGHVVPCREIKPCALSISLSLKEKLRRKGVLEDRREVPVVAGQLAQEHWPAPLGRNVSSVLKKMRYCLA